MKSLGDISKSLNLAAVYINGLHARFELPVTEDAAYPGPDLEFLRALLVLRTLNISEDPLRKDEEKNCID